METVTIRNQEIFQSGGPFNGDYYTDADLDAMVEAFDQVGFKPPIKLGHAEGQEQLKAEEYKKIFGAPSLGQIGRLYRRGKKLFADFINVPKHLAQLINKKAYSRISAEIFWGFLCDVTGKKFDRVLKAVSLLGADTPCITSLKEIEALYERKANHAVRAYDSGREYRIYTIQKEQEMLEKNLELWKRNNTFTAISEQMSDRIKDYAEETGQDYATAARAILGSVRQYQQENPSPPANQLASVAEQIQSALKLPFVDAVIVAARERPDLVKKVAGDWLVDEGRKLARGKPGFQSDNEAAGIKEAIKNNPAVADGWNRGVLSESALKTIYGQWFK